MILFLDIDGVLKKRPGLAIDRTCVHILNRIIDKTDCKIVISSSWRYMILRGAMAVKGFEHMLESHDANVTNRVIGCLRVDRYEGESRGVLIQEWLEAHANPHYVILDDMDFGFTEMYWLQTDGDVGLQEDDLGYFDDWDQ